MIFDIVLSPNLVDMGTDVEMIMKIVSYFSIEMFLRYRTIKSEKLDATMSPLICQ